MANRKVINSPVDITAKTILAAAIGSGAATNGQALEADGAGGASWQSLPGAPATPGLDQVLAVSNVSNHNIIPNTDNHDSIGSSSNRYAVLYARLGAFYRATLLDFVQFWDLTLMPIGNITNSASDLLVAAANNLLLSANQIIKLTVDTLLDGHAHILGNSDIRGTLTVGAGINSTVSFVYTTAYGSTPVVVISPDSNVGLPYFISASSTTGFTISVIGTLAGSVNFNYIVIG